MDWAWHAHQLRPLLVFFCFGPPLFSTCAKWAASPRTFQQDKEVREVKRGVLGRGEIKSNGTHAIVHRLLYIFTFWQVPRQAVCLSACLSTNYARGGLFLCFFSFSSFLFLIASAVVEMTQGCCNDRLPATSGCLRGMPSTN